MPPIVAPSTATVLRPRRIAAMFVAGMAVAFAIIGALLIHDTRTTIEQNLIAGVERQSEQAARQLGGGVFVLLRQLGGGPHDLANSEQASRKFDSAMRDALNRHIRELVDRSAIVKVKIYSLDGMTVFSTAAADIGQMKYAAAFDAAVSGQTSTELNRRERFAGLQGELRNVVLAASYIPIRWGSEPGPTAVLETYTDVTADIATAGDATDAHARLMLAAFAILFLFVAGMTVLAVAALRRAIVSRDQQAAARATSEALFGEAIDSIADGLLIFAPDQRLLHWNSRMETIFANLRGKLRRDMTQRELLEIHAASDLYAVPPGDRSTWVTARLSSLQPDRSTYPQRLADGRVVQESARHRRSGGYIVVVRDISSEAKSRTALAEATARAEASERRFRDFAEAASDWFWEAGPDGRLTYLSPGITRFGVSPDMLVGRGRSELPYRVPSGQPGIARIAAATAAHEPFKDVEYHGVLRDGSNVFIAVSGRPQFAADGTFLGHRGTGRDITDVTISRQSLEAALAEREAQERSLEAALHSEREGAQQQRRFIAIVAHEFRTPLTIIDGAAQRLARNAAHMAPAELLERVERIRRAVGRMSQLIDDTLNSARLDSGRIEADRSRIDLVQVVTSAIRRHEDMSRDFTFTFTATGIDGGLPVVADERLLDQVFANLLSNATKYSGDSRRIDVTIAGVGENARVTIRDHGLGVPAEEIPKLFTRFFRASTARGLQGTGIGLNLVKELVALHDGTVDVASIVGEGSAFSVTLPLAVRGTADAAA